MSSQSQDPETAIREMEERPRYLNPVALEIKETDYQQWRHNPLTQAFLLFLAHRSDSLARDAIVLFKSGRIEGDDVRGQGLRGRLMELEELCTLKLSDMQRFYLEQTDSKSAQGRKPSEPRAQDH